MLDTIRYQKRDRIAFVTLTRAEAKNAIDLAMTRSCVASGGTSATTTRSTWPSSPWMGDSFCAGADLRTWVPANYVDATPSRVREIVDLGFGGLTRGLHRIDKPIIASINGWALAAGLELALACDIRIASGQALVRSGFPYTGALFLRGVTDPTSHAGGPASVDTREAGSLDAGRRMRPFHPASSRSVLCRARVESMCCPCCCC